MGKFSFQFLTVACYWPGCRWDLTGVAQNSILLEIAKPAEDWFSSPALLPMYRRKDIRLTADAYENPLWLLCLGVR